MVHRLPLVGIEAALRFQNILGFWQIVSAMRSRAMFDSTAYLKYKTRALICGGKRHDKISDVAVSIGKYAALGRRIEKYAALVM